MRDHLQSAIFGRIEADTELPDYLCYTADIDIPDHGTVTISLVSMADEDPDWPKLLRNAEASYPVLLEYETAIRQQAAARILTLQQARYADEWTGPADELITFLRLENLNFFSNGTFELWYFGGEPFCHNNLYIALDADMRVADVGLDG